ncbi:hypothetical protein [Paenibacillus jilunlii]|uniref:YhfM-like domain-containing protein n=1 Tax=Paenibacillus jilunlii TaxID=682956 RepID=A0A1G9PIX7_9BACL|nr:hypothetical protein [Paenibacillus jilunlii]KWX70643.1 hypothetical protein AML91_26685 [Paenibacillus jilunlii]SDL98689.1 hypothetical protein SAMN05216191_107217 [Paenibacillus jilunlii]
MKRISVLSISLIILLVVIFVLVRPKQEIVSVSLASETTQITYTDTESIQIFEDAIKSVKKVRGAVDVGPPTYRMTVTYADSEVVEFSLYMDFKNKNGFLIKNSNSETMLDLKDQNSEELADLLSEKRENR